MKIGPETTALVTGGDSGIGFGIAQAFVQRGARVVIAGLSEEALAEAANQLGGRVSTAVLDIRDREGWAQLAERLWADGGIDVLVNNAGVGYLTPALETSFEQWDWLIDIDLTGTFNGVRSIVPRMLRTGSPGRIVSTASIGGLLAAPGSVYAAAKAGVIGFMEALQTELWDTQIGVTILVPGIVRSNIANGLLPPGESQGVQPGGAGLDVLYQEPMEPKEVGERVIRAIQNDALYVVTHAEHGPLLQRRFDAIRRAVPLETPPEARAAVERMVLEHPIYDAVRARIEEGE
ncbi:SDR family oxidoreductase [Subtercola endophyticus]|uniref:SDR family oxidoreductase n=1 Tax=Subtercola endophyticus TaxID=2895559 RepID=UPI001E3A0DDE|nr:SDR family oxidoreductase [Subtercola endophyticus]UFS59807.1 SDR family oxidoreductase [Subtercola endophyticus]